jgi:hypothetical protein
MPNVVIQQKLTCKGTLRQMFIFKRPPSPLGFCLGWKTNFVGSESGLQNMVSNTTQHPLPLSSHTLSVYTELLLWEGGCEVNQREG